MPRILNVNSYHYRRGGSDVMYFNHAQLMENHGWDNAFFSMKHPLNLPTPWSRYFVDELEFGHDYSLPRRALLASKVIYSFEARRKIKKLLADFPVDLSHLHCIYHHLSPSILSLLSAAGPVVLTAHDLKIACPAYKMYNAYGICERCKGGNFSNVIKYKCIHESAPASLVVAAESTLHGLLKTYQNNLSKIIVPSRFFIDKFVEWGWSPDIFEYIPNYVEAARFLPVYEVGRYFLYFGRLAPEKGISTLIKAAAIANVPIKIAGTGPDYERLLQVNAEHGGIAEFLGYLGEPELRQVVGGSRAVVLPSEWYENASMSVLESGAMGKPVIGSRIGGMPEIIEEGFNGWMFQSSNAEELAILLSSIARLPDVQVESIGRNAREHVVRHFSRDDYVANVLSVYANLGLRT